MRRFIWAFVLILSTATCKNNKVVTETVELSISGDTVFVSETSPILNQLVTQKSYLQDFLTEFSTTGTVRPVSGKIAEIAPPFEGRIVQSHVRLGQKVADGSPVFDFSSSEFHEATKAYFVALSANELAQRQYNRQKELAANGVAAQKDLEQAKNEVMIYGQELEQAKAALNIFNIDAASLATGIGPDVQRPLATVIVYGLFFATILTLFILPAFYYLTESHYERKEALLSEDKE